MLITNFRSILQEFRPLGQAVHALSSAGAIEVKPTAIELKLCFSFF